MFSKNHVYKLEFKIKTSVYSTLNYQMIIFYLTMTKPTEGLCVRIDHVMGFMTERLVYVRFIMLLTL